MENGIILLVHKTSNLFYDYSLVAKKEGKISLDILQGMENELEFSEGCDGYLIALANVEPQLCKKYLNNQNNEDLIHIKECRSKYNLGGNWYISLKAILMARNIITSAEEVNALPYS